ncbi:MAG: SUMF1/EgtB/PvdO family nonheme iron enzyme [Candidatus Binatia bacterium]
MSKPTIFISYSHRDTEWKNQLETHLRGLQLQDRLDFWTDEKIGFGDLWFEKIQAAMNAASVAVLLVSPDFLASEFIVREEVKRLLERREKERLPLFPILVRPCFWKRIPWLAQTQMRPRNGIPLSGGTPHEIDECLTAIVEEIDRALERGTTTEPEGTSESPVATFRNRIGMEFLLIPAGEFRMGTDSKEGSDDERPVHRVRITRPFYLGKYPVTQGQWEAVMGTNSSAFPGDPNRPVECVSWNDAQEFLQRLSEKEEKSYRLPTEAEWEYAARAGSNAIYCFGDDVKLLREYAWYAENSGGKTHRVGQLDANVWELHDMHGNVWEWVQDWYAVNYYQQSAVIDPQGPEEGQSKVVRGGSWRSEARDVRVARRGRPVPGDRSGLIGFRCAQ